jgi:hypothetical protein
MVCWCGAGFSSKLHRLKVAPAKTICRVMVAGDAPLFHTPSVLVALKTSAQYGAAL